MRNFGKAWRVGNSRKPGNASDVNNTTIPRGKGEASHEKQFEVVCYFFFFSVND
jgi:hypothetical protein